MMRPEAAAGCRNDWTADDGMSLPEDLWYELRDGELRLSEGARSEHWFCAELTKNLRRQSPESMTAKYTCTYDSPAPDIVVTRREDADEGCVELDRVVLAVDVLASHRRFAELFAKVNEYAAARVGHLWIIGPGRRAAVELIQYRLGPSGRYDVFGSTTTILDTQVPFPVVFNLGQMSSSAMTRADQGQ